MSTDIWFRDDIANILRSVAESCRIAMIAGGKDGEFAQGYQEGFAAALWSAAVALGVDQKLLDAGVQIRSIQERQR